MSSKMQGTSSTINETESSIDRESYEAILSGLQLLDISLRECKFSGKPEYVKEGIPLTATWKQESAFQTVGGNLVLITQNYTITGKCGKGKGKAVDMRATYHVVMSSEKEFTESFFNVYRKGSLLLHTWPFMRELVNSMTLRNGLPPMILPIVLVK